MNTPDQERLDVISEALAKIIRRQDALESRFRRLEIAMGVIEPPAPASVEPAPVVAAPPPIPPPVETTAEPPRPPVLETQVGLNWVNRIGVILLIAGAAFAFKYAVENKYIGEGARVSMGVIAAMAALYFGDRLWNRDQKVFAQGLTGLGIALLYLSFYATFGFYHLLPQAAAFALMVLATISAGVFALRYDSQAIAALGLVGGYLTPILLSTGEDHPWILFSYTFLLNLGGLALARFRRWRVVEFVPFFATYLLFAGWLFGRLHNETRTVATVFAIAFYAQFAASESRVIVFLVQLFASFATATIWTKPADFLPLALLFAAGGIVIAELRKWDETVPWTLVCYWIPYGIWIVNPGAIDNRGAIFALLTVGFAMFYLWIFWWATLRARTPRSTDLLVLAVNAATYFGAGYALLNPVAHDYMGLFAVAVGAVHLLAAKVLWKPGATVEEQDTWPALLATGITLTFLTLAVPIQFTGFRITIAWAIEGAALAWLASRFDSIKLNVGAWLVFALVVFRLFMFDAWIYSSGHQFTAIVNARFFTFLTSAIALWLAARFARSELPAAAPYIAGHFVMLWALGLEVIGWAERSAAPADVWSYETTGISIMMALYALVLVSAGIVTHTMINRLLGLGLIGIVLAKLCVSDVWELSRGFRITVLLGLGLMLMLVSYLYSRFRPVIERLWRDE